MKMNRVLMAALASSALLSASAMAADGTITFNGQVTASACTTVAGAATIGGTASNNATIGLPNVTATSLSAAAGTYAGHTPFTIELSGCQATAVLNNVRALFTTTTSPVGDSNIMGNTAVGGAGDVGIAILSGGNQVDLNGGPSVAPGVALPPSGTPGAVSLQYTAAYKSLSTSVTTGPVQGITDYVISYY
ncbi:major type 1 subunit fimbrin (pilin) [Klebsiella oxytoca]|uniref:Major type 1 subunit fimbrin (Pilin) n=1 Tax=Klebsiella oxytoca TaxID=571 RepID=A0A318FX88_KLEOX|nr:fimbrial protein [Klebsiella oxytoca]PXW46978.1 major type 1 subunit fimbrin (pilin) [Klebsiella oxytoca]HCB1499407.1 hypothetical protein [Klebsiella michiganensis]HCB1846679.1 hypothetical protein [Klebsiella oxytoca]